MDKICIMQSDLTLKIFEGIAGYGYLCFFGWLVRIHEFCLKWFTLKVHRMLLCR